MPPSVMQGDICMMKNQSKLARPKNASAYFGVSIMTLWRWRQSPSFPQPLVKGRIVLYDLSAIEAWLRGEQCTN